MESSRDDFVIAIRSAFIKKGTQQRFSLLTLIFFSIIFLVLGGLNFKAIENVKIVIKEITYRSSFLVSTPENLLRDSYLAIQNHQNLYKENEKIFTNFNWVKSEKNSTFFSPLKKSLSILPIGIPALNKPLVPEV